MTGLAGWVGLLRWAGLDLAGWLGWAGIRFGGDGLGWTAWTGCTGCLPGWWLGWLRCLNCPALPLAAGLLAAGCQQAACCWLLAVWMAGCWPAYRWLLAASCWLAAGVAYRAAGSVLGGLEVSSQKLNSGVSSLVLPLRNKLFTAGLCLFELLAGLGWIGLGLLAAWAGKLNSRVLSLVSSRRN